MEYSKIGSLQDLLEAKWKKGQCMPKPDVKRITRGLIDAIGEMLAKGIQHCDIKPENVFFDDKRNVKLANFGSARVLPGQPGLRGRK